MAKTSNTVKKYKATERLFEWIPIDSPDFADYMADLKKGNAVELKKVSAERMKWALANELLILS